MNLARSVDWVAHYYSIGRDRNAVTRELTLGSIVCQDVMTLELLCEGCTALTQSNKPSRQDIKILCGDVNMFMGSAM